MAFSLNCYPAAPVHIAGFVKLPAIVPQIAASFSQLGFRPCSYLEFFHDFFDAFQNEGTPN